MKNKMMVLALLSSLGVQAQDTYLNERLTNNSGELTGSARYVGMGGAMGALGADISTISWNPAGIGLFRKSDLSLTFGGQWNNSRIDEERRGRGTLDQLGFVYSMPVYSSTVSYFNVAFNYQKKINFYNNFYADNAHLRGLSQMDQLAELVSEGYDTKNNLAGLAKEKGYFENVTIPNPANPESPISYVQNLFGGERNFYTHHSEGSLQGYDLNFSTNFSDRAYLGLTLSADNLNYSAWTDYYEQSGYNKPVQDAANNPVMENGQPKYEYKKGDYSIYNDYKITGYGLGVKLGAIVRPFEENSFRLGLTVETPTWYRLKSSVLYDITNQVPESYSRSDQLESYLEYILRTPWKLRASMGSTIGNYLAWGLDYEWANYAATHMGYPKYDEWEGSYSSFGNTSDKAMNNQTKEMLKAVHTLRSGVEIRPTSRLAFRLGYNLNASAYENRVSFDQLKLNSAAMDYCTNTSYMRLGNVNTLTLGMGYRWKHFYADLAYKVRNQQAEFYAFDTHFTSPDSQFSADNPDLINQKLDPTSVDLTRQSITCTLGVRF